ncbi:MAG: trimethylamine methyltransferase family protein [Syntrophobacterales bacterium]
MIDSFREGVLVKPYERLNQEQIEWLDDASLKILGEPGIWCYNERAAKLFQAHGAQVTEEHDKGGTVWRVRFPAGLIKEAVSKAPSQVVLGARTPENRLWLDAEVPRAYFGSGSEANIWIETEMEEFVSVNDGQTKVKMPRYKELRGNTHLLCRAAKLCDKLEHLDFFIRPLNIQDPEITAANHDVNKFFASLNNITKHVQAGLTELTALPQVVRLGEIITGGPEALRANPVISFITCVFKSPLQIVADTADKVFGPVRARLDDLHDLYGCPEFNQYNIDCVQLARHYRLPCYSTAGVGDAKVPGMQALFEKLFTHLYMAMTGAQYIHYAFGLLDRTNTFCPLQAVLDNEQIGKIKHCLRAPKVNPADIEGAWDMVKKVMSSSHRLFARHVRKALHSGDVSSPYQFETREMEDKVIENALAYMHRLEAEAAPHLNRATVEQIFQEVPGILPHLKQYS